MRHGPVDNHLHLPNERYRSVNSEEHDRAKACITHERGLVGSLWISMAQLQRCKVEVAHPQKVHEEKGRIARQLQALLCWQEESKVDVHPQDKACIGHKLNSESML